MSVLSFGSRVTSGTQLAGRRAREGMAAAYQSGVNFFDNAEAYAGGVRARHGEAIPTFG